MTTYLNADVRFNGGAGALLCNVCRVILAEGFDHEDVEHLCESCYKELIDNGQVTKES